MSENKKVLKYRKAFQPNFGKIVFLLLVIYLIVIFVDYINKEHISIYEVNETQIADDTTLTGIILRNERISKAKQDGYINYFNPDGNRVRVGDVIYTIDSTGNIANTLANMEVKQGLTNEEIANLRSVIAGYQENFNASQYDNIYACKYDVENVIFEQTEDTLYSDLEKVLKENGQSDTFQKGKAKRSGVISYSIDGYEGLKLQNITMDTFVQKGSYKRQQLKSSQQVKTEDTIYKTVIDEEWSLVVPLTEEYFNKLQDKTTVRVNVKKDSVSFNADLVMEQHEDGIYAILTMSRFMQRYINDRFLDIELQLNSAKGLKIPNSSIVKEEFFIVSPEYVTTMEENGSKVLTKETVKKDGTVSKDYIPINSTILLDSGYYVSKNILPAGSVLVHPVSGEKFTVSQTGELEGVYCVNEGYCKFIRIEKKYENAEYTIIEEGMLGGLAVFDHIVVNPDTLNENDFID